MYPHQLFHLNGNSCHFDSSIAICIAALEESKDVIHILDYQLPRSAVLGHLLEAVGKVPSKERRKLLVYEFLRNPPSATQEFSPHDAHDDMLSFLLLTECTGAVDKFRDWFREYFSMKYCRGSGRFPNTSGIVTWFSPFSQRIIQGEGGRLPTPIFCGILSWQGTCVFHGAIGEFL